MSLTNKDQNKLLLISLGLISFLGTLDLTIVYTAIPAIRSALGTSVVQVQWVMNAFLIALATSMMIVGRLSDIYGQRRILHIGIALFAISSLAAGLAPSITLLIIARIVYGGLKPRINAARYLPN